jgi:hypothetical protein
MKEILDFPAGHDGTFPYDQVACREIVLGERTVNSCNISLADVDDDGLDEIIIPITEGELDDVRAYKGDGTLLWKNNAVQFYHAYYDDPTPWPPGHIWYRSSHRHLLTEVCDVDDDGAQEVIVGDGPVWILDAETGQTKTVLDLGGGVALWTVFQPEPGAPQLLAATVTPRNEPPFVTAVDVAGRPAWRVPTPGRVFCDCIHAADLTGDGRPEIGFSVSDAGYFWMMDAKGNLLWSKDVQRELSEAETHVDDFVIDRISPAGRPDGNQILVAPGPNLLDCAGKLIWTARDRLDHAQSTRVRNLFPDQPGKEVYSVDSYDLVATLFTAEGEVLWDYDNFTRVKTGVGNPVRMRLSTASDWVDWFGQGEKALVQTEIVAFGREATLPEEPVTLHIHVLDRQGRAITVFPFQDDPGYGIQGAMCGKAARVTGGMGEDVVVVTHNSSKLLIFSAV